MRSITLGGASYLHQHRHMVEVAVREGLPQSRSLVSSCAVYLNVLLGQAVYRQSQLQLNNQQ